MDENKMNFIENIELNHDIIKLKHILEKVLDKYDLFLINLHLTFFEFLITKKKFNYKGKNFYGKYFKKIDIIELIKFFENKKLWHRPYFYLIVLEKNSSKFFPDSLKDIKDVEIDILLKNYIVGFLEPLDNDLYTTGKNELKKILKDFL